MKMSPTRRIPPSKAFVGGIDLDLAGKGDCRVSLILARVRRRAGYVILFMSILRQL